MAAMSSCSTLHLSCVPCDWQSESSFRNLILHSINITTHGNNSGRLLHLCCNRKSSRGKKTVSLSPKLSDNVDICSESAGKSGQVLLLLKLSEHCLVTVAETCCSRDHSPLNHSSSSSLLSSSDRSSRFCRRSVRILRLLGDCWSDSRSFAALMRPSAVSVCVQ